MNPNRIPKRVNFSISTQYVNVVKHSTGGNQITFNNDSDVPGSVAYPLVEANTYSTI